MSGQMDLNALDRFALVVEAGSFSAAARWLGVSRQAVQRSVDTLEQAHGVVLIERSTRALRLTDAGRRLHAAAARAREAGREADAILTAATQTPRGRLRVTAPPLLGNAVLARVIPAFLARWPAVEIEARFVAGRTDPRRDDFDLTLRVGAPPPEDAYAIHLGRADIVLCASRAWVGARSVPSTPAQIGALPTLVYGLDPGPWVFTGPAGVITTDVRPRLRGDSAELLVAACRAGLGVLRVPEMAVVEELRDGTLCRILPDWTLPGADMWAIYGHRTRGDPTLAAFLDALREADWGARGARRDAPDAAPPERPST